MQMRNAKARRRKDAKVIYVVIVLVLMASVIHPAASQEQAPVPALLVETDEGIVFYGLGDTNELVQVGSLPPDFTYGRSQDKGWVLTTEYGRRDITLSPDNQYLAFTARFFGPPVTAKLFIYNLQDNQIREGFSGVFETAVDPPEYYYIFSLRWSPDSRWILANPHPICCSGPFNPMPEMYTYDLANHEWWSVTNTPDKLEWEPAWSSDSESIAYTVSWDRFFLVDREGNNRRLLAESDFNLCDFTWSDINQRWYYVRGRCSSPDSTNLASIASVTVEGDGRTEASISDWLVQEVSQFQGYMDLFSVDVTDLYAAENGLYAGLEFLYFALDENDQQMGTRIGRVIRIDAPEVIKMVFEYTFDDADSSLSQTVFAPDGSKVALVSTKKIMVGDLTTGHQPATTSRNLEDYWQRSQVRWLDENRLLYNDETDVWLLDSRDGTNTNLTADIEPTAWLIPQTNSN